MRKMIHSAGIGTPDARKRACPVWGGLEGNRPGTARRLRSTSFQVVTITDDGHETTQDVACVERHDLTPETFGLSLAEGKAVLQALQEVVVAWQMHTYLQQQRACPHCGKARRSKGVHHTVFRTVFGALPVDSPRLYHCGCQPHTTTSFSPLATLLPERTTPDLLYLETQWAALMSYGLTVKLLQDVLPLDEPLAAVTIRNHVLTVAQRLEDALGEEHWSFINSCPAEWTRLPAPDGPLTVGIDGGYVKAQGEQGWFEVIAGKSLLAFHRGEEAQEPASSKCFAFVQTYDQKPKRRLFEVLQSQGHQLNQQITFLSDGGDTVRDLQLYLNPQAEHLLDWFHVAMRLTVMQQTAKSLPETTRDEEMTYEVRAPVSRSLERLKWFLWHGNVYQALQVIQSVGLMTPRQGVTPPPEITFLTQDEVRRLFAVIPGKRDRTLFQLAYHHGLRASEVSLLQREDVHEKQGRIYIPRVKGSIAKTYPLQPEDLRLVRAYLRTREDDSPSLFISTRGIPLERRSYWDLMQKYGKVADIPKSKRRFHALRHAIAVHLLDAGADVAFVQDRLGHAHIQNTMVYMRYTTVTRDAQTRQLFASHRVV